MANHKSALKRIRQNEVERVSNRYKARTMRNALKKFRALKEKGTASESLPKMVEMIDKLACKKVIHKNKASNLKSKLARQVNKMK
jgi:small subunit ribosomal protein S20